MPEIFTDYAPTPHISDNIIITFSNSLASRYNKMIRYEYFHNTEHIAEGDILQVVQNSYSGNLELLNGEFVTVLKISNTTEEQKAPLKRKGKPDKIITLQFRDITIMHPTGKKIEVKILDTLLNSRFPNLNSDEMKALYINFIIRFKEKYGKVDKKSEAFKEAFRTDKYFNALRVKYGYAITGHKSQGGEWENVFIDFNDRIGIDKDKLRWTYTAITRANKKLYVINPPKLKQIAFNIKDVVIGKLKKTPNNAIKFPDIEATPYHNIETHPAKRIKYFEIEEKMFEKGYSIENVESGEYIETYTINVNNNTYNITMNHNGAGIFTYYTCNTINNETDELIELLKEKKKWSFPFIYEGETIIVKKLYQIILSASQNINIDITNIDDSKLQNYFVTFFFRTTAESAYIQFYFDKNERIKSMIAKSLLGEEDVELKKLIGNMTKE